jgi:hypothetical protein
MRILKNLASSILRFSLIGSAKSLLQTFKMLYSFDALMIGAFAGGYVGIFRLLLCQLRRYRKCNEGQNAAIAAFLASFWMMVDRSRSRRIQIACLIFIRSLDSVTKMIDNNGIYDRFLTKYAPRLPGYDQFDESEKKSPADKSTV